jgi:hypothetical protein
MMSTAGQGAIGLICPPQDITVVQVKANIGEGASQRDDNMADAVLVCAADASSAPMERTPELCRDRTAVVMVGAAFLQAVRGDGELPTEAMLSAMRATIAAADRARAT